MLYAVKLKTTYVGTDAEIVFEAANEQNANEYAQELAYNNAAMFFEIVPAEEVTEDMDDSYLSDEDIDYTIVPYDPNIHGNWDRE